ncbi:unnamed protein product [Dicrocoelium dendriticum]|nr:unnamed protein product [Dicrocoelium dendriticum]
MFTCFFRAYFCVKCCHFIRLSSIFSLTDVSVPRSPCSRCLLWCFHDVHRAVVSLPAQGNLLCDHCQLRTLSFHISRTAMNLPYFNTCPFCQRGQYAVLAFTLRHTEALPPALLI